MIEEGEDILDRIKLMMNDKKEGMTMETVMDITEVINTLVIGRCFTSKKLALVLT